MWLELFAACVAFLLLVALIVTFPRKDPKVRPRDADKQA